MLGGHDYSMYHFSIVTLICSSTELQDSAKEADFTADIPTTCKLLVALIQASGVFYNNLFLSDDSRLSAKWSCARFFEDTCHNSETGQYSYRPW